jgi:hypothetical protein
VKYNVIVNWFSPEIEIKEEIVASFKYKNDAYMHICRKIQEWTKIATYSNDINREYDFVGVRIEEVEYSL